MDVNVLDEATKFLFLWVVVGEPLVVKDRRIHERCHGGKRSWCHGEKFQILFHD
jgi:hypothetical protein